METLVAQFLNGRQPVKTSRPCGMCADSRLATVYCDTCKRDLCSDCAKGHRNNADMFKGHGLTPYNKKTMCNDHPNNVYSIYCNDCSQILCTDCDVSAHVQHQLRRPEDAALEHRLDLERSKLRACELSCRLLEHRVEVKDKMDVVKRDYGQARDNVMCWLEALRGIEDHLGGLLGELEGAEEEQESQLEDYSENLNHFAHIHQELADFLEKVQDSPAVEILQQQKSLTRYFPSLDLHQPPVTLPRTPEIDLAHIRDMFDVTYRPDVMFDLMSLSDDGYLDDYLEDADLPEYVNSDDTRREVIPSDDESSDAETETEPPEIVLPPRKEIVGPLSKSSNQLSSPPYENVIFGEASSPEPDEEVFPEQAEIPPTPEPVTRRESKNRARLRRQEQTPGQTPVMDRQVSACSISKITLVPFSTKVYDVKWCESLGCVIVRTGDAECPLKRLSLTTLEVTPFSTVSLSGNHLGMTFNTKTADLVVTVAPSTLRLYSADGTSSRDIIINDVVKIRGVTYCAQGDLYIVTDPGRKQVVVVNACDGDVIARFGGEDKAFESPVFVTCDGQSKSSVMAISDRGHHAVKVSDLQGQISMKFGRHGCTGNRKLRSPAGVWMDPSGGILVCDWGNRRVVRFSLFGTMEIILSPEDLGGRRPFGLDVTPEGVIIVSTWEGTDSADTILIFSGYTDIGVQP